MSKRVVSGIMLSLLLIGMLILTFNIQPVKAELKTTSEGEPSVESIDFYNGTRLMIIDYGNETKDYIKETFVRKTAKLLLPEDEANQSLSATLPTSLEESTDYVTATQTLMTEQEVLLGFTETVVKERYYKIAEVWLLVAYARVGIVVDIEFGLRLPINVTIEYPEQMTIGNNYTWYATLTPIDKSNFDELLFKFKAYLWVEAGVWSLFTGWVEYSAKFGPDIDESRSFTTPLGPEAEAPLPEIDIMIFDSAWIIGFSLLKVYLSIEPSFGSEKITSRANSIGDARLVEGANFTWSIPNQRLNFTVNCDDYDNTTDCAKIWLSNFRYYFTIFRLHVGLLFDFDSWIDWLTGDPRIPVYTIDLSELVEGLYLETHEGYPRSVSVTICVEREIPPEEIIGPRDVAILFVTAYPNIVSAGQIVNITVKAKNFGNETESFNVTVYYDDITLATQVVSELAIGEETILVFLWNTTSLLSGKYSVRAEASAVPNEIDVKDNIYIAGTIYVKMLGDINGDGVLDISDVVIAALAFGSMEEDNPKTPWNETRKWNPDADLNNDGIIDIVDLVIIGVNYGKELPL